MSTRVSLVYVGGSSTTLMTPRHASIRVTMTNWWRWARTSTHTRPTSSACSAMSVTSLRDLEGQPTAQLQPPVDLALAHQRRGRHPFSEPRRVPAEDGV